MMTGSAFGTQFSKVAWALALLAAYLLTRPYTGLHHDSLLYAAQALHQSGVDSLGDDLFFSFGNQGAFVVFPILQGALIDQVGLGTAQLILRGLSSLFWLVSLGYLARTIYPEQRQWLLAMGIAIVMFAGYGNAALSYGEGFVTSRPFAEAFGLLALAFALRGRLWVGAFAVGISIILHPLVGVSVFGLWLLLALGLSFRFFVIVILGLAALVAAGSEGLAPASWIFETHDPEWSALLHRYESLGLILNWGWVPVRVHALGLVVLLIATRMDDRLVATFSRAVLLAGLVMVAASIVGADLLGNRFVAALQPWRVLLWVSLSGHLLILHVLLAHSFKGAFAVILLAAVLASAVEHLMHIVPVFSSALAGLALLAYWANRTGRFWRWINALLGVATTIVLIGLGSYIVVAEDVTLIEKIARLGSLLLVAIAFALTRTFWAIFFAVIACWGAVHEFDRRGDKLAFVESDAQLPAEFVASLSGKTVYWEGGLEYLWIKLRQPQFYSCQQRAGTLFYRDQALEHERRGQLMAPLNTVDFTRWPPGSCPPAKDQDAMHAQDNSALQSVCAALPELDVLILNKKIPGAISKSWRLPIGEQGTEIHQISCK